MVATAVKMQARFQYKKLNIMVAACWQQSHALFIINFVDSTTFRA